MSCAIFTTFTGRKYLALLTLVLCLVTAPSIHTQHLLSENTGVLVALDWRTIAAPTFGVTYQYTWDDIHVRDGNGNELPTALDLQVKNIELGIFDLTTKPIAVPSSGMVITFTRLIEIHPTNAERGTMLWTDPLMNWRNSPDGPIRASVAQGIDVLDAVTNELLMINVDWYKMGVTRREILLDNVATSKVVIDLSPFAGKHVVIRARVLTGYNGRGPSSATDAMLNSYQDCSSTQIFK
jgi:hypothetical protein